MNQKFRWLLVFVIIFALTQDYLFFDWEPRLGVWGFPTWLGWFVAIHLLLVLEFIRFQKKYWK